MKKDFNRNPKGSNQWETRTNEEIQEIIGKYTKFWTKKDFRGEGVNNSIKILTRHETQRPGLKFGQTGKGKQSLKEVFNGKKMKQMRINMLNNKPCKECNGEEYDGKNE